MKLTGHANFQLHEALNFIIERVVSLPVFVPEFCGRFVFVATMGDPDFGVWYGTTIEWKKLNDGAVAPLMQLDFSYINLVTDAVSIRTLLLQNFVANAHLAVDARIYMIEGYVDLPLTAGSIILRPTINEIVVPGHDLDVVLDSTHALYNFAFPTADYLLTPGDKLGIQVEGSVGTLPSLVSVRSVAYLYVTS